MMAPTCSVGLTMVACTVGSHTAAQRRRAGAVPPFICGCEVKSQGKGRTRAKKKKDTYGYSGISTLHRACCGCRTAWPGFMNRHCVPPRMTVMFCNNLGTGSLLTTLPSIHHLTLPTRPLQPGPPTPPTPICPSTHTCTPSSLRTCHHLGVERELGRVLQLHHFAARQLNPARGAPCRGHSNLPGPANWLHPIQLQHREGYWLHPIQLQSRERYWLHPIQLQSRERNWLELREISLPASSPPDSHLQGTVGAVTITLAPCSCSSRCLNTCATRQTHRS
jgi:hypothetical protein